MTGTPEATMCDTRSSWPVMPSTTSQDRVPRFAVELVHPDVGKRARLTHTKDEHLARQVLDRVILLTGLPKLPDD